METRITLQSKNTLDPQKEFIKDKLDKGANIEDIEIALLVKKNVKISQHTLARYINSDEKLKVLRNRNLEGEQSSLEIWENEVIARLKSKLSQTQIQDELKLTHTQLRNIIARAKSKGKLK